MDRRTFIKSTAAAGLISAIPTASFASSAQKKVLFLGGTDFFGPGLVDQLIERGHDVTLFNRGKTNPHLFPNLKKIRGDRETVDGSGLDALRAVKTQWDWVIDTWQKSPKCVADTTHLLKDRVGLYQYVSSIAVYRDASRKGIDETYPLKGLPVLPTHLKESFPYSIRKALSEKIIYDTLGDRTAIFRSHGMRGKRMAAPRYEPYWPVRINRGGDILVPADAEYCQMTDMASYGDFMIRAAENNLTGIYNVAYEPMPFKQYIQNIMAATKSDANLVWVSEKFLAVHGVRPYRDLPMWRPHPVGFYHYDVQKALKSGLKNRPQSELIADQLSGFYERYPDGKFDFGAPNTGTISSVTEEKIIDAWRRNGQRP